MVTIEKIKQQIEKANALGVAILKRRGADVPDNGTTYEIMEAIDNVPRNFNDEFWNIYQENGKRSNYAYGFSGRGWSDETFKPKFDIIHKGGNLQYLFAESRITNLKAILEECGVTLDFSQATSGNYPFSGSQITHVGVLDFSGYSSLAYLLHNSEKLVSVDKLILKNDGSQGFNSTFSFGKLPSLEHMIVEGCIGKNNFDVSSSVKLDKASLLSIINCLQDKSADTDDTQWVVTIGPANKEKLTEDELAVAENKGWTVA